MRTEGMELDPAKSPEEIEARSFALIEAEIPEPRPFTGALWRVARRCVHTAGDTAIVADLRLNRESMKAGLAALERGCTVYTDTRMAAAGLPPRRLRPLGVSVTALPELPGLEEIAVRRGITRARAAMEAVAEKLDGQIIVVGNAPTALLALLESLEAGAPPPALIIGMPVGFVNAAQSKRLLAQSPWPHFTLLGRRGGSAVAAACVNALAELALERLRLRRGENGGFLPA